MQAMQDLPYHGDAGAWSIDFVARTRELYDSGATLEHFVMQCAFNSFEGKNSQILHPELEIQNKSCIFKYFIFLFE